MANSTTIMVASNEAEPCARDASPFKHPRPPPGTPAKTAQLWDKYERQAIETARKRERNTQPSQPQRLSIPSSGKGCRPEDVSPTRPSFDFKFRRGHTPKPSTTVATCKMCTLPISYTSGVCEGCTKIIVLPSASGETTPPLSPAARNFASTDLPKLRKNSLNDDVIISASSSRRTSYCPLPAHLADPSFRLSALLPPPEFDSYSVLGRRRKMSLTDPNEPFLRLQIAQQSHVPRSAMNSPPITPTSPPWAAQSRSSTRRSSLANMALLPIPAYPHARNDSLALSEHSTLCPYTSTATTARPSLSQVDTALENTTSAWDDWDSDSEDRLGRSGWMGRRKVKSRVDGAREGQGSMDSTGSNCEATRPSTSPKEMLKQGRKSSSKEDQRLERARAESAENARTSRRDPEQKAAKKTSGFIRVISCGLGNHDD